MKLLFIDLETTGTMHWRNGIHQISGCIEIDGELKETFDYRVCPNPACTIVDEALAVSNLTKEVVISYPPMKDVYNDIISMLSRYVDKYDKGDKFFIVGYNNASFDNQFFRAFFVQNNDNYFGSWFWSSSIDVMILAAQYLMEERHRMKDFKLKTVAAKLGFIVDESKLHDATYDIELTRWIYQQVSGKEKLIKNETDLQQVQTT